MNVCSGQVLVVMRFVGMILTIGKIAIPLLIIVFGVVDLYKVMVSGKAEDFKSQIKNLMFRVIAGVFVFFIPAIVNFVIGLVSTTSNQCLECVLDINKCNVSNSNTSASNTSANNTSAQNNANVCSGLSENDCKNKPNCLWSDMSNFGSQFNNINTNGYYCTYK